MTTTPEPLKGVPRIEGDTPPTFRGDHNALADWVRDHTGESVATAAALPTADNWVGRTIRVRAENTTWVFMGSALGWRPDLIARIAQPRSNTAVANATPVFLTGSVSGTTGAGGTLNHTFRTPFPNGCSWVGWTRTDGNAGYSPHLQGDPTRTGFSTFWPNSGNTKVGLDYFAIGW